MEKWIARAAGGLKLVLAVALFPATALALDATKILGPDDSKFPAGAKVYHEVCAACHEGSVSRAPQLFILEEMTPETIDRVLTTGIMQVQASGLSAEQKAAVAEYLAGRKLGSSTAAADVKLCTGPTSVFDINEPPPFSGWGINAESTHTIPTSIAGVDRENVGKLRLKWAFGVPGALRLRGEPMLAGGAIFFGSDNGSVYALDRETGCVRWTYSASAEVRTAVVIEPWRAGDTNAKPAVYFGDTVGNLYSVNAFTGALIWKKRINLHPATMLTAAPVLYGDTLYVPISSTEEAVAASPQYSCCNFRGSIVAVAAATGAEKWRTWLVDEAVSRGKTKDGREKLGPSGIAVWNTPSIDATRKQLYIGTGDNYSSPVTDLADSIVAIDLATGKIKWHYQASKGDAWNTDCVFQASGSCPDENGPDYDFGAGTILAKASNGHEVVLAGQKSGIAYGVDPDTGKLIWQTRVGRGGAAGGIHFGMAAEHGVVFVPVTDTPDGKPANFPTSPGLYALDIATGKSVWRAPEPNTCGQREHCSGGLGSTITATEDLVLSGADDGHLRIYDAKDGKVLWENDTVRDYTTVNGVAAHGGAIAGGMGPILYKGDLIVGSGYGYAMKTPGNALLMFTVNPSPNTANQGAKQ